MKSAIKAVEEAAKDGDKSKATVAAARAMSEIDRALKSGIIHRNAADRRKAKIAATAGMSKAKPEKAKLEPKVKKVVKKPAKIAEKPVKTEAAKDLPAKKQEEAKKPGLLKRMISRK